MAQIKCRLVSHCHVFTEKSYPNIWSRAIINRVLPVSILDCPWERCPPLDDRYGQSEVRQYRTWLGPLTETVCLGRFPEQRLGDIDIVEAILLRWEHVVCVGSPIISSKITVYSKSKSLLLKETGSVGHQISHLKLLIFKANKLVSNVPRKGLDRH